MQEISFAVIGAGFMGRLLARVAADLPFTRCVGTSDVDEGRAAALAAECGGKAYGDFHELVERERPNAVIIATPEASHCEPALAAAGHGCHVYIEKPLATTLSDADAIITACRAADVKLMVGYILRFDASYAMIKSAVASGTVGRILSMYGRRVATIAEARRLGGRIGPITYIGVHDFDQMLWYHPVPVRSVIAHGLKGRAWQELGVDDLAWVTVEFDDGVLGIEQVGWTLPEEWANWRRPADWGGFGDVRMNVIGTEGALELNLTPMDLYGCDREGWKLPDTRHWPTVNGKVNGAVRLEVEEFFDAILHDRPPLISGEDGRRSLEIALAAEESVRLNRPLTLPLESQTAPLYPA